MCSKRSSKYSETTRGVCIVSHATVVGAPVEIASTRFTIEFSLATGIIKKSLSTARYKKKNHDKVLMLAESKLNSIETLACQALIDMEISHEEFITILKKKINIKYEKMKENARNFSGKLEEKAENIRLNSVNLRF